ncbi:hypothetical protein ACE1BJ_03195, partial [Aeromonas jandaei]
DVQNHETLANRQIWYETLLLAYNTVEAGPFDVRAHPLCDGLHHARLLICPGYASTIWQPAHPEGHRQPRRNRP